MSYWQKGDPYGPGEPEEASAWVDACTHVSVPDTPQQLTEHEEHLRNMDAGETQPDLFADRLECPGTP